jgi:cellulose synthase/poly-beta-1,6-N-acetylglucosamine synthase-like glycosyltransferase
MLLLITLWLSFFTASFVVIGLSFFSMKRKAQKPWRVEIDESYKPKISILLPTYNESNGIRFKLENLKKLDYPEELIQIIVVDSNSTDNTLNIVYEFIDQNSIQNIQVLKQTERKGKSAALNYALKYCTGELVIVSDADCFWPNDILQKALPFLADPNVGAISGPKIILNSQQSWVTKTEATYLKSMNQIKLGESKHDSTTLFEGGFAAYKKQLLTAFDPYKTGSDDCGTVITLTEKGARALLVPEAAFFTTFPLTWKGKMSIKIRRIGQLVRVFSTYLSLLARKRIKSAKRVIIQNILFYLISPLLFVLLLATTFLLLLNIPYLALLLLLLLVPKIGLNVVEATQSYLLLFIGLIYLALGKKFEMWSQPEDRELLSENLLRQNSLI